MKKDMLFYIKIIFIFLINWEFMDNLERVPF